MSTKTKKEEGVDIEKDPLDFSEEEIFNENNIPESNWFKFENIGDKVVGVLVELRDNVQPRTANMPAQRVFILRKKDGSLVNVGISMEKDYIIGRTNRVKMGDIIGFEFKKEVKSSTPGFAPAKSIEVYVKSAPVSATE